VAVAGRFLLDGTMRTSEHGNRPRWAGQSGFFEIWFLVVFEPGARRAWWFRYTTFAPVRGAARATLWAAAFDAGAPVPVLAGKTVLPISAYAADAGGVRLGEARFANGACRGALEIGGHAIAWDLAFTPHPREARRGPWLLERLPLPTRVSHANDAVAFRGWVSVDGQRRALADAPGVQKHIWGTRRVEELFWLYCPGFAGADGRLEATAVRLRRQLPGGLPAPVLAPVWAHVAGETLDWCSLPAILGTRVTHVAPGELRVEARSLTRRLRAHAWCDPRTLAAWVYRDPAGSDVYVAQSDVASCELEVCTRAHPFTAWRPTARLMATHTALEFHAPEPLAGVRYLPW
jgi:hypothetical protein